MKPPTLLRIASALAAVQGAAHGTLLAIATPHHGPAEVAVVTAMKSNVFDFSGAMRSYWDFYTGYGIEAAAVCGVEALILWQLASLAAIRPAMVRPIVAILALANLAHVALISRYFFYLPIVFDAAIAGTLIWAFAVANEPMESRR